MTQQEKQAVAFFLSQNHKPASVIWIIQNGNDKIIKDIYGASYSFIKLWLNTTICQKKHLFYLENYLIDNLLVHRLSAFKSLLTSLQACELEFYWFAVNGYEMLFLYILFRMTYQQINYVLWIICEENLYTKDLFCRFRHSCLCDAVTYFYRLFFPETCSKENIWCIVSFFKKFGDKLSYFTFEEKKPERCCKENPELPISTFKKITMLYILLTCVLSLFKMFPKRFKLMEICHFM